MATTPQPPHKPAPPPPLKDPAAGKGPAIGGGHLTKTGEPEPTIGVRGEPIEDGSRDPGTIAEEQRRRSAEIEGMGIEAWKAAHDDRTPEERGEKLEHHKAT